jgi:hypothetical protein
MNYESLSPELAQRVGEILLRELGPADFVKVYPRLGLGSGDYTEERRALFADLTVEDVKDGIRRRREARAFDAGPLESSPQPVQ